MQNKYLYYTIIQVKYELQNADIDGAYRIR